MEAYYVILRNIKGTEIIITKRHNKRVDFTDYIIHQRRTYKMRNLWAYSLSWSATLPSGGYTEDRKRQSDTQGIRELWSETKWRKLRSTSYIFISVLFLYDVQRSNNKSRIPDSFLEVIIIAVNLEIPGILAVFNLHLMICILLLIIQSYFVLGVKNPAI